MQRKCQCKNHTKLQRCYVTDCRDREARENKTNYQKAKYQENNDIQSKH